MVADHYQKASGRRPSLNFFKADYRDKKAMTAVLEAYESPPGFALDSIDSPILRRSKITGVIHFAAHKAQCGLR
jgi:UDP-glucose 4-epimerase